MEGDRHYEQKTNFLLCETTWGKKVCPKPSGHTFTSPCPPTGNARPDGGIFIKEIYTYKSWNVHCAFSWSLVLWQVMKGSQTSNPDLCWKLTISRNLGSHNQKEQCLFSGLGPSVYQRGAGTPISVHSWEWKSLIPVPELWSRFSIPFQFLNIGNKFLSFLSVPDFWEWYDCTLVPLLCSRKLFPSIPDKWGRKRFRPWQDSNLQSPDPKSGALSIRPHGPTWTDFKDRVAKI